MLQAQIFVNKDELKGMKPLPMYIMDFLHERKIAGATAFKGWVGFGSNQRMQQPNQIFSFDETPTLITFIDESDKVISVIKELRQHVKTALIITNNVETW